MLSPMAGLNIRILINIIMFFPETKIKSNKSDRFISGLMYYVFFIPWGFLIILFVHFYYRKNKYIRFHTSEAGLLWIIGTFLSFASWFLILPFQPFDETILLIAQQNASYALFLSLIILSYLIICIIWFAINIIISLFAFKGRCFRFSHIFDFLKRII